MIQLYFSDIGEEWPEQKLKTINNLLPPDTVARAGKFHRWQDRQLHTGGRLLLRQMIRHFGQQDYIGLDALRLTPLGKPYFEENFSFSITHSGLIVACAGALSGAIGIDIELVAPVAIEDFKSFLTQHEWDTITKATCQLDTFYEIWCRKEALAKATGEGLTLPLAQLDVLTPQLTYKTCVYHFQTAILNKHYKCSLVTDKSVAVNIEKITI